MAKNTDPFREIMQEVTANLTANLRDVLATTLEKQLTESLTQSLLESEFYRRISKDMRSGLKRIYNEVSVAQRGSGTEVVDEKAAADKLFHDASEQLSEVLKQTEEAANNIIEMLEKHIELQALATEFLEKAHKGRITPMEWERLREINATLNEDLAALMTTMSFQDLTGQRIKKAVAAIKQLESTVLELYVSSGLMLKAHEETPGQSMNDLEAKTKAVVADITQKVVGSELKGPTGTTGQADIDDLLAQFGL